jgi:hypothetical protein
MSAISKYNQAIKVRPQKAVGWTRKETRALYSGVMCVKYSSKLIG